MTSGCCEIRHGAFPPEISRPGCCLNVSADHFHCAKCRLFINHFSVLRSSLQHPVEGRVMNPLVNMSIGQGSPSRVTFRCSSQLSACTPHPLCQALITARLGKRQLSPQDTVNDLPPHAGLPVLWCPIVADCLAELRVCCRRVAIPSQ